jgi:putative beta-lysine N-acetyltransferase
VLKKSKYNALQVYPDKPVKAVYKNADEISKVYRKVFKSYPFPIYDSKYIIDTMKNHVIYYIIRNEQRISAVSSAEIDVNAQNAEMTDFATLPSYRGKGLANSLLCRMEKDMIAKGIKTSYTIARAGSYAINTIFAKSGYKFSGTLVNNTNIAGSLESMNVWYKCL